MLNDLFLAYELEVALPSEPRREFNKSKSFINYAVSTTINVFIKDFSLMQISFTKNLNFQILILLYYIKLMTVTKAINIFGKLFRTV